jgi:hypothetical protein
MQWFGLYGLDVPKLSEGYSRYGDRDFPIHAPLSFFVSDTCLAAFERVSPFLHAWQWQKCFTLLC